MRRQSGLTLIEFMISIVLGMVVVAAMAVLIANQSTARSEVDRAGKMIETGRYSMQTITDDLQMAGYWGESSTAPTSTTPTGFPNPCTATVTSGNAASPGIQESSYVYVQGYDDSTITASLLSTTLTCLANWKSGTDILVIRRADPDTSAVTTTSATPFNCTTSTVASGTGMDLTKLNSTGDGQLFLQTGLATCTSSTFGYVFAVGASGSNSTTFTAVDKNGLRQAPRKWLVHIYYIATCDVCTGTGIDTIPTLKRAELTVVSGAPAMTTAVIAEGIENMQIEYGVDSSPAAGDGSADSYVNAADASLGSTVDNWQKVVSAKIYLVARSTETSPNYSDPRLYCLQTTCSVTADFYAPGAAAGYQRHLFMQSVRLSNPSMRRS